MVLRSSFVLLALAAVGCSHATEGDASTDTANETSSAWKTTEIGQRPNRDVVEQERVSLAIDAQGHRHAVYLGSDGQTHYADLTNRTDVVIPATQATYHAIALDPAGEPNIAFTSGGVGVMHASRTDGAWKVEPIGTYGTVDGFAIDASGTLHIASDTNDGAKISTKAVGASAFEHAEVPGKLDREIGFGAFAFAVDKTGGEYAMLSSFESIDDSPTSSHSGPTHTYFVKRAKGGQFSVEMMTAASSAGSLAVDGNNVVHAIMAVAPTDPDAWSMPVYIQRGPNDAAWSAPEKIYWDGYYSSLAIDASGTIHVAFSGNRAAFAGYAKRPVTGGWTVEIANGGDAHLPSLALDPSGKPLFAFRDGRYELAERVGP